MDLCVERGDACGAPRLGAAIGGPALSRHENIVPAFWSSTSANIYICVFELETGHAEVGEG